jgi:hypothetical protein
MDLGSHRRAFAAQKGHILAFLLGRVKGRVTRTPIIFDFIRGRVHRASSSPQDLATVMKKRVRKTRVVKTVEGIPPKVIKTKS